MKSRWPGAAGVLVVGLLFVWGLARLFSLRFASGDDYPPGSSRRSDPLGTRALHDGLAALPGYSVQRNYGELERTLTEPGGHTLFLLGFDADALGTVAPRAIAESYDHFVRAGGRLVLALADQPARTRSNGWFQVKRQLRRPAPPAAAPKQRTFGELWGLKLERGTDASTEAIHDGSIVALPVRLPWLGRQQFTGLDDAWRVIYARDGESVVMERKLGRGSLVLFADDFLLSNEALRHRRETALLSWLVGGNRRIVFDETHLGLTQNPGLASLMHRYRLGGAAIGMLILIGLYLWQQAVPFVPRVGAVVPYGDRPGRPDEIGVTEEPPAVIGREAAAGFRNLLRRSVPMDVLVPQLFALWRESAGRRVSAERLLDAQDVLNLENARPPKQRNPLATYNKLAEILSRKSR